MNVRTSSYLLLSNYTTVPLLTHRLVYAHVRTSPALLVGAIHQLDPEDRFPAKTAMYLVRVPIDMDYSLHQLNTCTGSVKENLAPK